jgi:hypothetical protein
MAGQLLARWNTCFTHGLSWMLSSVASWRFTTKTRNRRRPRRAQLQERNLNLFDLLLDETYLWETLREEHKRLAIEILGRLIANSLRDQDEEKNHE